LIPNLEGSLLEYRGIFLFQNGIFTPLEIMLPCSAAGLYFRTIPAGVNAPLEFLTGFTVGAEDELMEV